MRKNNYNEAEARARKRLRSVWHSMLRRCENNADGAYHYYGGRGIKVCAEWHDFEEFFEWAIANGYDGSAPRGKCTIDRIDNDGDYTPRNCRWADAMTQAWNKRPPSPCNDDLFESLESFYAYMEELDAQRELWMHQYFGSKQFIKKITKEVTQQVLSSLNERLLNSTEY